MTEIIAKTVVKNKMWIVERGGAKIGNIMAVEEGGFVYIHDQKREMFPSIKLLSKKHNIEFVKAVKHVAPPTIVNEVYGFPTNSTPHNQVLDVQRYLPIYTKGAKSKSFFCAGHYIVKYNRVWVSEYCPKLITLNRYEYQGPFKTQERMQESLREANDQ
jgi:hypothetical protein